MTKTKIAKLLAVTVLLCCAAAIASTKIRDSIITSSFIQLSQITGSTIDSTTIGGTTPYGATFTTMAATSSATAPTVSATTSLSVVGHGVTAIETGHVSGCSTDNNAWTTCSNTITWGTAFPDSNYYVSCTGYGITGNPHIVGLSSKGTSSITVLTGNGVDNGAVVSSYSDVECLAIRP